MDLKDFIIYLIIAGLFVFIIETHMSTPIVYWSHSDDKCVAVYIDGDYYGCDNIPEKYERIWVK